MSVCQKFKEYIESFPKEEYETILCHSINQNIICMIKAKTTMIRAEPMTPCTAGIATSSSTMFMVLQNSQTHPCIWHKDPLAVTWF